MKMNKALDFAICKEISGKGGYCIGSRHYDNYMNNEHWEKFKREMESNYPDAFLAYNNGSGKELEETKYPPKMASFGSSSKFIYELSRDIKGFEFEKQLPTHIGGRSNLDGFLGNEDYCICVEAKCREPYGNSHKGEKRRKVYKEILEYISTENLGISFECVEQNKDIRITSKVHDKTIEYFDIVQLVCHYCGIANQLLEQKINKNVKFLYLVYDPNVMAGKNFEPNMINRILSRHKQCIEEINNIDHKKLFAAIMRFFSSKSATVEYTFEFICTSQSNFRNYIHSF